MCNRIFETVDIYVKLSLNTNSHTQATARWIEKKTLEV